MTAQSFINGQLGREIGNGLLAAVLSFAGGLAALFIVLATMPHMRQGLRSMRVALREHPPWRVFTLAGSAGAAFVFSQGALSTGLGLSLFTVAFVSGVTAGGLVMDRFGIGPAGYRPISWMRLSGAILGVVAVAVAVSGSLQFDRVSALAVIPFVCGVGVSWQQAANGRLTQISENPWSTTLVNFAVGFGMLMIALAVTTPTSPITQALPPDVWMYLGGPVGIVFIAISSVVVRYIGILVYGLCATTGQLVSALVLDALGLHERALTTPVIVGVVLVAIGAILASRSPDEKRRT